MKSNYLQILPLLIGVLGMMNLAQGQLHPVTDEPISDTYAVHVDGNPVPVIRYEDIDYVQFPFTEPVDISITRLDGKPIESSRIRPERLGYEPVIKGSSMTFALDQPRKLFVNINLMRKVLILAEPVATDRPSPDSPGVVSVLEYQVDRNGRRDNTDLIQKTIDELPRNAMLYFPPGRYLTGSLHLKNDMTLYLDENAILKGNNNPDQHQFRGNYLYFLRGEDIENVKICGMGTIDANGDVIRNAWQERLSKRKVPGRAVLMVNVKGLVVQGVTVRDSYSWNVHVVESDNVRFDNVKVLSSLTHSNGDGLDLDGCVNVLVDDCLLYCEDDAITPKAAWSNRSPENYLVRNCILWSQRATGIRLGAETHSPAFRNMVFENIDFLRANTMIRIYNYDGADIHNIVFRNLWIEEYTMFVQDEGYVETNRVESSAHPGITYMFYVYMHKRRDNSKVGPVHDVLVENVHSQRIARSKLYGLPLANGDKSIWDITFRNLYENGEPIPTAEQARISHNEHAEPPTFSHDAR